MIDYKDIGYTTTLLSTESPLVRQGDVTGLDFESDYDRGLITTSKIYGSAITSIKIEDAAITNAKINDVAAGKITAGTLTVAVGVGTSSIEIDGANSQIIVNDGTVDRVLIGKDAGGF